MVSKRLRSRLSQQSCQPIAMVLPDAHASLISNPSVRAPVRVTRSVQRTRDAMLLAKSTKITHPVQSKFVLPSNPIEIDDDDIDPKKSGKRKRNTSKPNKSGPKEIVEIDSARAQSFRRRSVIRGRVITGFGGDEMSELLTLVQAQGWTELLSQGTLRRRMGREETREFYLNATGSDTSISSTVCGVSFTLNAEILSSILGERGLAYGFWLGMVFEHFRVPVKEWQIQTIKDVLGVVNHETIPATKRGANAPMQRLRASLTAKTEEINALQVSHSVALDKLHIDYGLQHDRLAEENSRLKEELAQTQAALNTERLSNSDRLKHLYELLTKNFSSSSSAFPPSV
ncbi:hypothetical protein KY289_005941 [Solanum tuberosum]|nr:hypothetical protein KY284_006644 [Solanum tuberosum]KAH0722897.1 hypothetical protein KY289_005941 [Solanum tuberosum]